MSTVAEKLAEQSGTSLRDAGFMAGEINKKARIEQQGMAIREAIYALAESPEAKAKLIDYLRSDWLIDPDVNEDLIRLLKAPDVAVRRLMPAIERFNVWFAPVEPPRPFVYFISGTPFKLEGDYQGDPGSAGLSAFLEELEAICKKSEFVFSNEDSSLKVKCSLKFYELIGKNLPCKCVYSTKHTGYCFVITRDDPKKVKNN